MRTFLSAILVFISINIDAVQLNSRTELNSSPLKGIHLEPIKTDYYSIAINELKRREGFADKPYKDTDGIYRIGYGTRYNIISPSTEVDTFLADSLLKVVFNEHIDKVKTEMKDFCYNENQYLALAMLSYNVGFNGFKYYKGNSSGLYKQLIKGEDPVNWLNYINVSGKPSKNLIHSRNIEYKIFKNEY